MIKNEDHPRQAELGIFHVDVLKHHIAEFKAHMLIDRPEDVPQYRYRIKRFQEYLRWRNQGRIDDRGKQQ